MLSSPKKKKPLLGEVNKGYLYVIARLSKRAVAIPRDDSGDPSLSLGMTTVVIPLKKTLYLWVVLFFACCQAAEGLVIVQRSSGSALQVRVEVADTAEERTTGLMFRTSLPDGEGMLFVFPDETQTPFWMKNTPISLDLIFIRGGRVVDLIENTVPNSEELLIPETTYTMVLEVPGGYAFREGIQEGDLIEYRPPPA